MRYLVDTNVLLRWARADSAGHSVCADAVDGLLNIGHEVCVCAQVLIEFRAVATRPVDANGLGLHLAEVQAGTADIKQVFTCLAELPDMADRRQVVADRHAVVGKPVHDARIVALMLAHGVTHLLTLNPGDFTRYQDITPLTPSNALAR